jgi:hypothetical protein
MAERRMFAKTIIDSDAFIDMPLSTQALYFHLSMRADDDGFINNPKKIQRMIGASDDDLKVLIMKRFIIPFESGIVVIKHWKIHNYIRNDRYKPTIYSEEKAMLESKENGAYTEADNSGIPSDNQVVYQMETQYRLGKDSIGKDSIGEDKKDTEALPTTSEQDDLVSQLREKYDVPEKKTRKAFSPPSVDEVKAYCTERNNSVDAEKFVDYYSSNGWMVGKNKMKDWKAAVRTWEKNQYGNQKKTSPTNDTSKFKNYTEDELPF